MKVCVTGATGFVGRAVIDGLRDIGVAVVPCVRARSGEFPSGAIAVGDVGQRTDWSAAIKDADVVVHAAGRAHVMNERVSRPLDAYREVNVEGTRTLAEQCLRHGVKKFIFLSSIAVNGKCTRPGECYKVGSLPSPVDAYGLSKWEAEQELVKIFSGTGVDLVVIRPPLVYGRNPKGNLARLIRLMKSGLWLPFGGISGNLRSFVGLDNLVSLVSHCVINLEGKSGVVLVSDGCDLSTREFCGKLALGLGCAPRMVSVPPWLAMPLLGVVGKSALAVQLFGNLQVSIEATRVFSGWEPEFSVDECMRRQFGISQ